jgi:hypothetical protein
LIKTAGAKSRFLAFLGDFSLGLALFFYFNSYESFRELYLWLFSGLKSLALATDIPVAFANTITFIILSYFLTIALRFYGTLLFGSSLFQKLLGIHGSSTFWWNRIGGSARVVLELILGPFLIFDLAAFRQKVTLKEKLSQTKLLRRPSLLSIPVAVIVIPILLIGSFYTPLLQNLTLIDGIKVSFTKEVAEDLSHSTSFENFKELSSNNFSFSAFSTLANERLILIPGLDLKRQKKKRKVSPFLYIYDLKNKTIGKMKSVGELRLVSLLALGAKGNPLFNHYFPELGKILKSGGKKYNRIQYKSEFKDKHLLNPLARQEIKKLVRSAFELSVGNLIEHSWTHGPFIHGLVLLRRALVGKVDKGSIPNIDFVKIGNYEFLRLRQHFDEFTNPDNPVVESLIPMDTLNSSVFRLSWGSSREDSLSRDLFKKELLATTHWYFDYENVFDMPSDFKDFSALSISDFLIRKKIKGDKKKRIQEFTIKYFTKLGHKTLHDEILRPIIITEIKRLLFIGQYKSSGFDEKFITKLLLLLDAINSKNESFFLPKASI